MERRGVASIIQIPPNHFRRPYGQSFRFGRFVAHLPAWRDFNLTWLDGDRKDDGQLLGGLFRWRADFNLFDGFVAKPVFIVSPYLLRARYLGLEGE